MIHRLLAGLLVGLALCAPALAQNAGTPATLSLTGTGMVQVDPDIATLRIGVDSRAATAAEALAANSRAADKVIAALRASGVAGADIQTANFSVHAVYKQDPSDRLGENRIAGYQVTNEVVARVRDLAGLGALLDRVVAEGANRINSLEFGVENATEAMDLARALAVEDAWRKAGVYAEAAVVGLGRVLSITEVGDSAGPMADAMFRAVSRDVPIEAGQTALSVTVAVVWQLNPGDP